MELYNARAEHFNEVEILTCKHINEKKELRSQIKALKAGTDQKDHSETMNFMEEELRSSKLSTMNLENQVKEIQAKLKAKENELVVKESEIAAKSKSLEDQIARTEEVEAARLKTAETLNAMEEAYAGLQEELDRNNDEKNDLLLTDIDASELLSLTKTISKNPCDFQNETLKIMEPNSAENIQQSEESKLLYGEIFILK